MKRSHILAGNYSGDHIFRCSEGRIHFNYGNVEIRFCQQGFLKFAEIMNEAMSQRAHVCRTSYIFNLRLCNFEDTS